MSLLGSQANKDRAKSSFSGMMDFGAYMYFAWPVFLPIYLAKTRGFVKGTAIYLGIWLLYILPYLLGGVAYEFYR